MLHESISSKLLHTVIGMHDFVELRSFFMVGLNFIGFMNTNIGPRHEVMKTQAFTYDHCRLYICFTSIIETLVETCESNEF